MSKTSRRCSYALTACLALIAAAPAAALAVVPAGDFSVSPEAPDRAERGENVTFRVSGIAWGGAAPGGTATWTFGDGTTATTPLTEDTTISQAHAYANAGIYTPSVTLTNPDAADNTTALGARIVRVNAPPVAIAGDFLPVAPVPGVDVLFSSGSYDPDGDAVEHEWDFGDGVTSPQRNAFHAFRAAGTHTVTLRVSDPPFGGSDTETLSVPVLSPTPPGHPVNRPPIARFAFGPRAPRVGDAVEFVSTAVDPDGQLRAIAWDLDGDGQYDDARGGEVIHTYLTGGARRVRLRVEDDAGLSAVHERTVDVGRAPKAKPGYMRPPPDIGFNALLYENGLRVQRLSVDAPRGAVVAVRCKGKGKRCPAKIRRKRAKRAGLRFKTFERFLRSGTKLEIYVRKPNTIGTFRRYVVRTGKGPKRIKRCLPAGARSKPRRRCG